jgi:hypothetical protein
MARSPEQPPKDDADRKFNPEEEKEITRKWYKDTSFEGRTGAEFKALRKEVREATILDFTRYRDDQDYKNLTYENPHVREFMDKETKYILVKIFEERADIGLSDEQFNRLLARFDENVQDGVRQFIASTEAVGALFKRFSPAELKEHSEEYLAAMQKEIELQERNVPHKRVKLPPPFPQKKSSEK